MNKVYLVAILVLSVLLVANVSPIEGVPTGGCPLSDALCAKYCKSNKYGKTGKCTGTSKGTCKCLV
uniref:Putative potassium channel toxin Ts21 n=1 Tax=Tityus serrulatus TaxID=6887 RepID=KA11L_TITSE|nr:RecName: Full=Putative potassium channel toxin Ts21; AltName: Full=Putative KTx; AltName: Full=Tityustoxin-21; Flags: Precursor [Tityus serrulatus]QPD99054.1 putative potassium channel toxin Ts21 [Tityus serrulatus]